MAIISKNIENLKPDKEYVVTVRAKNPDVNVVSNYSDSIRFRTPTDSTIPNAPTNLELAVSFFSVLFKFDISIDEDVETYEYELYSESQVEIIEAIYYPKSGETPHRTGFSASNVFLISVESNSSTTQAGSTTNPVKYYGRVRTIDTSNNISDWTQIVESGDTPLIDEQFIGSLTAAKITAGEIGAHTIQLNGSNSIIQSSNYVPGTSGWSIFGDGSAEFLNVTIGGDSTIENMPGGGDFETVATNFNNRNDRISTTPNDPTNVAFDTDVTNLDASIDLVLNWDFTVDATPTDAQNIDGFVLYLRTSSSSNASDITTADLNNNIYEIYLTAEKRSHTFAGISSSYFYRAAVRAYRMVDDDIDSDGIIYSSLVNTSERAATTPLIGGTGIKIGSGKIYIGAGNYGNADTGFYVDSTGDLSLGEKFVWDYSAATLSITGEISAQTFNILNSSSQQLASFGEIFYLDWGDPSSIYGDSAPALVFDHSIGGGVDHNPSYIIWTENSGLSSFGESQAIQIYGPKLKAYEYDYIYPAISLESTAQNQGGYSNIRIDNVSSFIHLGNDFGTNSSSTYMGGDSVSIAANGSMDLSNSGTLEIRNTGAMNLYNRVGDLTIRNSFGSADGLFHRIFMPDYSTMIISSASGYGLNISSDSLTLSSNSGNLSGTWSASSTFRSYGSDFYIGCLSPVYQSYQARFYKEFQFNTSGRKLLIESWYNGSKLVLTGDGGGLQSRNIVDNDYAPVRASIYYTGSSVNIKTDIEEARPSLRTLLDTPIYEWKYISEKELAPNDNGIIHIFPMAEDLPSYMYYSDENDEKLVDIRDVAGFLWKASQESYQDLNNKITALEQRLQALES